VKSTPTRLLLALACLLAPAAAYASEPATEEFGDIILKGLNLVFVFGAIAWFGREPIRRFLADRRETISHDLGQAAKLLSEAEHRFTQWERRLAGLDAELAEIRQQMRQRAEAEGARILAEAAASAERMKRDATAAVAQELRRARTQLRAEAAELAVSLAGKLLLDKS